MHTKKERVHEAHAAGGHNGKSSRSAIFSRSGQFFVKKLTNIQPCKACSNSSFSMLQTTPAPVFRKRSTPDYFENWDCEKIIQEYPEQNQEDPEKELCYLDAFSKNQRPNLIYWLELLIKNWKAPRNL